jgi:glycosyltransferase involved in cell wall biosynthesis
MRRLDNQNPAVHGGSINPVRLSVIIPTCGRETLIRTLKSVQKAGVSPDDEIIVVGDGRQPRAEEICQEFREAKVPVEYLEFGPTHGFGGSQRNHGIRVATGEYILFMDDDDEYTEGALDYMREMGTKHRGRIMVAKMLHRSIGEIWKTHEIKIGNIGTQMLAVPNDPPRLAKWTDLYVAEYLFLRETADKWPMGDAGIVWLDRVICTHHFCPEDPRRI